MPVVPHESAGFYSRFSFLSVQKLRGCDDSSSTGSPGNVFQVPWLSLIPGGCLPASYKTLENRDMGCRAMAVWSSRSEPPRLRWLPASPAAKQAPPHLRITAAHHMLCSCLCCAGWAVRSPPTLQWLTWMWARQRSSLEAVAPGCLGGSLPNPMGQE